MPDKPVKDGLLYWAIALAAVTLLVGACFFFGVADSTTEGTHVVALPSSAPPVAVSQAPENFPDPPPLSLSSLAAPAPGAETTDDPIVAIAKLAANDPAAALAEAVRETDPELRQRLVNAVLKAWAAKEPDAAARAALTWPGADRVGPIAAVLEGVASRPSDALRLGTFFCREDPAWAPEHGRALIAALSEAGQFSAAVSFALVGGAEVEGEDRNKLLTAAFAGWSQREPQLAAIAATSDLPEEGMRQEALIAVMANWRRLTPDAAEKFVEQLPPGPERTALVAALAATKGP
ncbi:MAG TPA: hypothetical protein VHO24_13135 [Opitutaceae bacterium]|nr:hypothetical protein [Opitutaceae bacterium]